MNARCVGLGLRLARAVLMTTLVASCSNSSGPAHTPTIEFLAPIQALFSGMQDTVLIARLGVVLPAGAASWSSSDTTVLVASAGGVVAARRVGTAFVRVQAGDMSDSLRIAVIEPPTGQIVFAGRASRDGASALWVMRPDGSGPRQVWVGDAGNPSLSPDGCRVVFQSSVFSNRLWNLDLTTGAAFQITQGASGPPAWSPADTQIVFAGLSTRGFDLFSIRPDGTGLIRIASMNAPVAFSSDFFPDGRSIAVERLSEDAGELQSDLYLMDLTAPAVARLLVRTPAAGDRMPSVAPDGIRVAFSGPAEQGSPSVVRVFVPDSAIVTVTPQVRTAQDDPASAGDPSFSPDGRWVAFEWNRDSRVVRREVDDLGRHNAYSNTLLEIYVMRLRDSLAVRLTHFFFPHGPDWGPECACVH